MKILGLMVRISGRILVGKFVDQPEMAEFPVTNFNELRIQDNSKLIDLHENKLHVVAMTNIDSPNMTIEILFSVDLNNSVRVLVEKKQLFNVLTIAYHKVIEPTLASKSYIDNKLTIPKIYN